MWMMMIERLLMWRLVFVTFYKRAKRGHNVYARMFLHVKYSRSKINRDSRLVYTVYKER